METEDVILDYVENFALSGDDVVKYLNERASLQYLREGLTFLYEQVKKVELTVTKRIDPSIRVFSYGNDPSMADIPRGLIACSFHWYSVSVCNYALMIGWLRHTIDPNSSPSLKYVESVLPQIKAWRDKVAAHFARAASNQRDNLAEQQASVLYPIAFDSDAFYASPMTYAIVRSGKRATSKSLQPWSLTKVHEQLRLRYWPAP